jgi:Arc/MetJ-type ribon-helix-helix transcriptional regulator
MSVPLASTTEQRIEREMARGIYREADEVVNRALDLLESQEDWLSQNREAIGELLEERWAESERGNSLSEDELLEFLARARQDKLLRREG